MLVVPFSIYIAISVPDTQAIQLVVNDLTSQESEGNMDTAKMDKKGEVEGAGGMRFIYISGGCFERGDIFGDGKSQERPVRESIIVTITLIFTIAFPVH